MEQNEHGLIADDAAKFSYELTRLVTEILHDIGVPAHIKGYQYLREAILIAAENMDILDEGATALYAQVAKIFQTTPSRVVRAMQHAIDVVWERADHEVIEKHCGYLGEKPGATRFIEVLADDVIEKMHEQTNGKTYMTLQEMQDEMECQCFAIKEDFLIEAANNGNVEAMLLLGMHHHRSNVGDLEKAYEWFRKAANAGCADAYFYIGVFYEYPQGLLVVEPSDEKAVENYMKAIELGSTKAMYRMGDRYYQGWLSTPKDKAKGLALIEEAAQRGNHEALFWLSMGEKDLEKALRYAQDAYLKLQNEQW